MKLFKMLMLSSSLLAIAAVGCSEDKKNAVLCSDVGCPAAPSINTAGQVDRSGRPAVTTALVASFEADAGTAGATRDSYNTAAPADWLGFAPGILGNLAILDAVDITCGNQFGADLDPTRYLGLAGLVADDRLWIDTTGTCTEDIQAYLGVEGNATGLLTNPLCGGRIPTADVGDASYRVLTVGDPSSTVGDGVGIDADCTHTNTTFPFLCAPI